MSVGKPYGNLFLCAGAMKAGTTWLYTVLASHPELAVSFEKEIHYFHHLYSNDRTLGDKLRMELARKYCNRSMDYRRGNADLISSDLRWIANYAGRPVDDSWYMTLFQRPRREMYVCDFSVFCARLPAKAWSGIEAKCEKLRVIYMLREPTRQLWSNIKFHLQSEGKLDMLKVWGPEDIREYAARPDFWENSEFGKAIRRMKAGLSEGSLKVIFFEILHGDRTRGLAEIEDFLNIPRGEYSQASLERKVNESTHIPMPEWFPELFADDMARIREEVATEGLKLPESWRD